MGCDIHMYVQYREKGTDWWRGFGDEFGSRDYTLFAILAGVRNSFRSMKNSYEPKGLPKFGLSYNIEYNLYIQIRKEGQGYYERSCTLEEALNWAKHHSRIISTDENGNPTKIIDPDWHSFSWLTLEELKQAFKWYKKESGYKIDVEYRAMLKAMEVLEDGGKNEVVVVFWFDN